MTKDKDTTRKTTQAPPPIESLVSQGLGDRTYIPRKPKEIDRKLWLKIGHWSIEEATHLLCGINPGFYKYPVRDPQNNLDQCIYRTYELLKRSYEIGELKHIPGTLGFAPSDILEWANKKGLEVPPELGDTSNINSTKALKTKLFPCKPGTVWNEIEITLIDDDTVRIETPEGISKYSYHELCMSDKRRGNSPIQLWALLKVFAHLTGRIDRKTPVPFKNFSSLTKRLDKHLKDLFQINETIYKYNYKRNREYVCYKLQNK